MTVPTHTDNHKLHFLPGTLGDVYNARLFEQLYKDEVLWASKYGGWFYFKEYWRLDQNDAIKLYAINIFDQMRKRTDEIDPDIREAWRRHVKMTGGNGRLEGMMDCAKAFVGYDGEFDYNQWLIGVKNGTVNLKTGDLYGFDPLDRISKQCMGSYKPEAKCPCWLAFIKDILEDDLTIEYMQKAVGYALTGTTSEQCLFILWGNGCNGKSTFIETLAYVLGGYSLSCNYDTIMDKNKGTINNDVARLKGARFVSVAESNKSVALDEAVIKRLTGQDKIVARFLRCENFEFYPECKIFFPTNHKPRIRGTDNGIWRRIKMIPFLKTIKPEDIDKDLPDKLKSEADGILTWAIDGCLKWQKDGLKMPMAVEEFTVRYEEEEDVIGLFLKDNCLEDKRKFIGSHEFKERLFNELGYKISNRAVGDYMKSHGYGFDRIALEGKQARVYLGLMWRSDDPSPSEKGWQE